VSPITCELVQDMVEVRAVGHVVRAGKANPAKAFEILRLKE
jgi:hypothetical protein